MIMNKLIIAAAGSGKTTFLVNEALKINDEKVLITTFTDANENEIRKKFLELNGYVPSNITIQTWFSFLMQHGVKPYQSVIYDGKIKGLLLVNQKSGYKYSFHGRPVYYKESELPHHYFSDSMQIYSDKIAKFVCKANEQVGGLVIDRLSRIYSNIFIDEVQDLAGYDLEIIKMLLSTKSKIFMVGDPRQVTYHTHDEAKYKKYSEGKIEAFILEQCKGCKIEIDKKTLNKTFRNEEKICAFANSIFPEFEPCKFEPKNETGHNGVFLIEPDDVNSYLEKYHPVQLRDKISVAVNPQYPSMNFGESKGLTFERVLIYPTKPMLNWLLNHTKELPAQSKSKLYVAITRAIYSVGIVFNNKKKIEIEGICQYKAD